MNDPTHPVHLGNLYAISAAIVSRMMSHARDEPWAILVQPDGTMTAHAADSRVLVEPGFVGWVSKDTDPVRFAARLAAAHAKVMGE
jgi:beta-lactamase class D